MTLKLIIIIFFILSPFSIIHDQCYNTIMTEQEWFIQLFTRLHHSKFRNSFHLKQSDKDYIQKKGLDTIESHAKDFVEKRLAPAYIANDGKQTPLKGHPVFIAQHATGTCCRQCLCELPHT